MRVLHSAALLRPPVGIMNQMRWEQEAAHQLGLNWQVKMFCPALQLGAEEITHFSKKVATTKNQNIIAKTRSWFNLRSEYHQWLISQEDEVDVFLLRYYVHDPFQLKFITECKKPVCLVHHTLEVPELASPNGIGAKARSYFDLVLGKHAIQRSSITIGVTNEIISYEKLRANQPDKLSILYPNGITCQPQILIDRRQSIPELLFVAGTFAPWHGLDLLLKTLKNNETPFILHLVGNLSSDDLLVAENDSRIVLHGHKTHQEINLIAESCWLGISSFALHRIGMKEACTLKVREYLMLGLPVYAGYKETFPDDFQFYRNGSLSIDKILEFAIKYRNTDKNLISEYSREFIDKVSSLNSLSNQLQAALLL